MPLEARLDVWLHTMCLPLWWVSRCLELHVRQATSAAGACLNSLHLNSLHHAAHDLACWLLDSAYLLCVPMTLVSGNSSPTAR